MAFIKIKESIDVLETAYQIYGEDLVCACRCGVESFVLIDLLAQVIPDAEVVLLDTEFSFEETDSLMEKVKDRYPRLDIRALFPEEETERYEVSQQWALEGKRARIAGLRRESLDSRICYFNEDQQFGLDQVCPLIYWTEQDLWDYIHARGLPYRGRVDFQNAPLQSKS